MQGGCEEEVRRQVDLEALRAHGRECAVEGAVNIFLMHRHVCGRVRRDMLQFRACMDGTLCQVRTSYGSRSVLRRSGSGRRWCVHVHVHVHVRASVGSSA